jgi:hypothetical protein
VSTQNPITLLHLLSFAFLALVLVSVMACRLAHSHA